MKSKALKYGDKVRLNILRTRKPPQQKYSSHQRAQKRHYDDILR